MDAPRFDAITRSLAQRFTRRRAVRAAGVGAAGMAALPLMQGRVTAAQTDATPVAIASPAPGESPSFLFTQLFSSGTAEAAMDVSGIYRLTLVQDPQQTLFFAERPSRFAGMVDTEQFFNWLSFDPNDPPNAALVTQTEDNIDFIAVIELTNPQLIDESTIGYDVRVNDDYAGEKLSYFAGNADNGELPTTFATASLFIDSQDNCSGSGGLCGEELGCCPGLTCQFSGRFGICQ